MSSDFPIELGLETRLFISKSVLLSAREAPLGFEGPSIRMVLSIFQNNASPWSGNNLQALSLRYSDYSEQPIVARWGTPLRGRIEIAVWKHPRDQSLYLYAPQSLER
jgi:hypothetical protein